MRNFKTEGIVIKRRNYKDSDRVLTILTKTHGKIYVRASGVRKITSRRAGHIELLNHSTLTLYQGNSYPILTEASTINNFTDIKSDLNNIGLALHLCELIDGLCPENQENYRVFYLLKETLERLNAPDYSSSEALAESRSLGADSSRQARTISLINEFEMQLLTILGYWNKAEYATLDTESFIENILERKLKSRTIFTKLQQ